ncbi:hypothetical protein NP233_g3453 [Leucocoprinus birnbaumii]|uniref:Uncharacterized protein n=1 Tax=Leucocoprinus birnbaumii TaxID=56174 RepID=A0AAD5VWG2_9AGAR|nr:hypothetical protein NP233_g3453 [Leucocoprinus birnbaumii]
MQGFPLSFASMSWSPHVLAVHCWGGMLDTVMITQDTLQPRSPVTSVTSGDESDQDTTRVYFGSLKTPEKRFAAIAAIPDPAHDSLSTPPSRDRLEASESKPGSPALSTSTCSDEFMDVERLVALTEQEEEGSGDTDVPQESGLPEDDEPSAVLASRLLRALDNPSPPPSPKINLREEVDETEVEDDDDVFASGEGDILPSALIASPHGPAVVDQFPPSIPHPPSEPDLMTFDSIDDLPPESMKYITGSLPTADQAPPSPFSFPDDSMKQVSVVHQPMRTFQGEMDVLVDIQDEAPPVDTPRPEESSHTPDETYTAQQEATAPAPHQTPHQIPSKATESAESHTTAITAEDIPHTPLRRSSRPRKSATPHILKYFASSTSSREASPIPSTPPRKSRKGKERATMPAENDAAGDVEVQDVSKSSGSGLDEKPADVKAQRRDSRSPVRRELTRELGSLSPNSADLLNQLIPSVSSTNQRALDPGPSEHRTSPIPDSPRPSVDRADSTPISLNQTEAISTTEPAPGRFSSPGRIPATPRRSHIPQTPSKMRLQSVSMDDPSRTPARRIPIEQAVAEGRVSPQKLSQMQTGASASVSMFSGQALPVLNTSLKGDSSPARRVFTGPSTDHSMTSRPESPSKYHLGEPGSRQSNHMVSLPSASQISQKATSATRPVKLPFPLVPSAKTQPAPQQDEEKTTDSSPSSPAKSSLKQTTSRIPRSKPYSKPKVTPAGSGAEKRTTTILSTSRARDLPNISSGSGTSKRQIVAATTTATIPGIRGDTTTKPIKRVIRAVDLSKSTTGKQVGHTSGPSPQDTTSSSVDSSHSNKAPPTAMVGSLKRKRLDSKIGPVASSRSTALRQVPAPPASTLGTGLTRPTASSSLKTSNPSSGSRRNDQTAQKPAVMKFRRVMPPEPSQHSSSSLSEQPDERQGSSTLARTIHQRAHLQHHRPYPPSSSPPPPPPPTHSQPPLIFLIDPLSPVSQPEAASSETNSEDNTQEPVVRRTSRPRKPTQAQPGTNVFSSDPNIIYNNSRPHQRRRSNVQQGSRSNPDDVFSGMSMNALKTLTANNTVRNQHYAVAMLETEIVRKEGMRPESPAVKIKTIVQRQQEEKIKQREERAARRARRHGEDSFGDEENNDTGYESPTPTSDLKDLHLENVRIKHRRGAGDEEEYETPLRNIDGEVNGKRRVKWDKGLYTEVFLDEVVLGSKVPPKENTSRQGCLTPAAKVISALYKWHLTINSPFAQTLRLDHLGNLMDLDDPFQLTQENVIVKKFVYDDEVEVPPEPVSPAVPVVRNTRSKSKKSKT